MTSRVAETLRAARARIAEPESWSKGLRATSQGMTADAAIWAAAGYPERRDAGDLARPAMDALRAAVPTLLWVSEWNDDPTTTHVDVLAAFVRAIAAEETK